MARNRTGEAAARFAERRQREDDARRLREDVPELDTLRLEVEERVSTARSADVKYVRHIIVERAPALFFLSCTERSCKDGGHDLTHEIMHGLRRGETRIEGEDRCYGSTAAAECGRLINYVAIATYR